MIHEALVILAPPAFGKSTLYHALRAAVDSATIDTDMGVNVIDADNIIPVADAFKQSAVEKNANIIEKICLIANRTVVFTSNPLLANRLSEAAVLAAVQHVSDRIIVRGVAITPCPFRSEYDETNTYCMRDMLRNRSLNAIDWMTPALTGHIYAPSDDDRRRNDTSADFSALAEASSWMSLMRMFHERLNRLYELGYPTQALAWLDKSLFANESKPYVLNADAIKLLFLNDKGMQASSFLCISMMLHLICVNLSAIDIASQSSMPYHRNIQLTGMPAWAVDALASLTVRNVERTLCGRGPVKRFSDLRSNVEEKAMNMLRSLSLATDCNERAYNYWLSMVSRLTTKIISPSTMKE